MSEHLQRAEIVCASRARFLARDEEKANISPRR
jgi:hypothetical protein